MLVRDWNKVPNTMEITSDPNSIQWKFPFCFHLSIISIVYWSDTERTRIKAYVKGYCQSPNVKTVALWRVCMFSRQNNRWLQVTFIYLQLSKCCRSVHVEYHRFAIIYRMDKEEIERHDMNHYFRKYLMNKTCLTMVEGHVIRYVFERVPSHDIHNCYRSLETYLDMTSDGFMNVTASHIFFNLLMQHADPGF